MVPLLLSIDDFLGESEGKACRVVSKVKKKYSGGEKAFFCRGFCELLMFVAGKNVVSL
jgi:hypothetical protein